MPGIKIKCSRLDYFSTEFYEWENWISKVYPKLVNQRIRLEACFIIPALLCHVIEAVNSKT